MSEINLEGWKGKDRIDIYERKEDYKVVEHRKVKETLKVDKITHIIPKADVVFMLNFLKKNCSENRKYKYRELAVLFIHERGWDGLCDRDSFNGGRNRAKYYFPYYYYPIKILEFYNYLRYFGRGEVILFGVSEYSKM